jgi:hypothetical protein
MDFGIFSEKCVEWLVSNPEHGGGKSHVAEHHLYWLLLASGRTLNYLLV